jgi:hypothetical protein
MRIFLSFALVIISLTSNAQVEFRGRVLDGTSKSGIPYATVYLTGTTLGVSTDEQGYFSMEITEGSYEVLVRMLGYEPTIFRLTTSEMQQEAYQISLAPAYPELDYLEVEDQRDPIWFENLEIFKQNFLGTSRNGKTSRILNDTILQLDSDSNTKILKVTAPDLLQIENSNLGYRMEYLLEKFTYSPINKSFFISGHSHFIEDTLLKKSKIKRVEINRRKAYFGSFQHLIRSLYAGTAKEEGFEFRTVVRTKNTERPDQIQIDAAKERYATSSNFSEKDSLRRNFLDKERLSPHTDELIYELLDDSILVRTDEKGRKFLSFENLLHVTYTEELESREFLRQFPLKRPGGQKSILLLKSGEVEIYKNGTYGTKTGIFVEGYMGWEKIGDFLPSDYSTEK